MSIVAYRRLIQGLGLLAVLAAGWGIWSHVIHRQAMAEAWTPPPVWPDGPPPVPFECDRSEIGMALGRFQSDDEAPPDDGEPGEESLADQLHRLGRIKTAIVVYPPYGDIKPALVFEFKKTQDNGETIKTIRLGESLIEVKQEGMGELKKPFRFKFVGVERDPKDRGSVLFVFDVDCDGKNLQKLRWVGDEKRVEPVKKTAAGAPIVVLFEKTDKGVITPTAKGRAHIEKHWKTFVKEVRTQPYIDKKSGRHAGVRILAVKQDSFVKQFGVVADDVILSINHRAVSHKSEAVKVIREEMGKHVTKIVVRLLRQGRTIERTYDPRDRETRAKARAALKGR